MRDYEELLGADYVEHNVHRHGLGLTRSVSVIGNLHDDILRGHVPVGKNKGHMDYLERSYSNMWGRSNKVGVMVDVHEAWSDQHDEDINMTDIGKQTKQ